MYRVLLVDDERIIAEGIMNMIRRFDLGFDKFKICENGKEALAEIENYKPDVIFTDIRMTYMDGLELSKQIRARNDDLRDVPIIIVTGYSDFNYAKNAIVYNVFGYMLKPIDKKELYDNLLKLRSLLNNKSLSTSYQEPYLLNQNLLKDILNSDDYKALELKDSFMSHNIDLSEYKGFYLVGFQLDQYSNDYADLKNHFSSEEQSDNIHLNLMRCFQSIKNCVLSSSVEGFMFICLIGIKNSIPNDDIWTYTDIYQPEFNAYIKTAGINVFISLFFNEIQIINKAYCEICTVKNYKKLMASSSILTYESIKVCTKKGPMKVKEIDRILEGIADGNLQAIVNQFDSIAEFLNSNHELSIKYVECIYSNLCMEVYKRFYSVSLCQKYPEYFDFFINIKDLIDRSASFTVIHARIREKILDFCMKYMRDSATEIEKKDIIAAVKKIIENGYAQQNLSLNSIAEKLYISSSHLSTLFRKEVGITFNEYLCQTRVNKSIKLLESGKIPISNIGKMIGYTSEKYYFVVFKRYTGISPAKYRMQLGYKAL